MVNDREPRVTTDELRAGRTGGGVRIVLIVSILLAVAIMAALLIVYR